MNKILTIIILALCSLIADAQVLDLYDDVKIQRRVDFALINDKIYNNVIVEFDAAPKFDLFKKGVKVTVKDVDNSNQTIFKKRFSKAYLYGGISDNFSQIVVGKGEILFYVILYRSLEDNHTIMTIKEDGFN